ncbi:hypothetical protein J8M21_14590 [Pseudoalteromonas luteoviolacea]|uniref:hypothetical protein n=1 Tax=Pseudoalteromonas luteoviolacea TaxID=43657 RepID=UPI001B3A764D|nr:hypothetical protein [Pseudoalteromonas luteoviolacea]MBQ4878438.1 hypothetical protein [Pseudoalteromonas luteoviolacea]MBQ4907593.1 hypothetical protein [Pseudoalteromonas luteoviolacea]
MNAKLLISTVTALFISACSNSHDTNNIQPALLTEVTPSVLQELGDAIVKLKGGSTPTLAIDVFTHTPQLLLSYGQSAVKNTAGMSYTELSALPISAFELQLREKQCVLYYPKTTQFIVLQYSSCIAYESED